MAKSFGSYTLDQGAVGLVFAEDTIGLTETVTHLKALGCRNIFVLGLPSTTQVLKPIDGVVFISQNLKSRGAVAKALNQAIQAFTGRWIVYCYNSEKIFFPFCETRSINDFASFNEEERRISISSTVVDLYTDSLEKHASYDCNCTLLDSAGYYAEYHPDSTGHPMRRAEVYGGLRWRFEEFFPKNYRSISRVSMFKALEDMVLDEHLNAPHSEFGTISTPWHNSPTMAITSFRAANYLKVNASPALTSDQLKWANSTVFSGTSQQLLELGFMETGQWF